MVNHTFNRLMLNWNFQFFALSNGKNICMFVFPSPSSVWLSVSLRSGKLFYRTIWRQPGSHWFRWTPNVQFTEFYDNTEPQIFKNFGEHQDPNDRCNQLLWHKRHHIFQLHSVYRLNKTVSNDLWLGLDILCLSRDWYYSNTYKYPFETHLILQF